MDDLEYLFDEELAAAHDAAQEPSADGDGGSLPPAEESEGPAPPKPASEAEVMAFLATVDDEIVNSLFELTSLF